MRRVSMIPLGILVGILFGATLVAAGTTVRVTGDDVVFRAGPDQGDLVYRHPQGHAKAKKGQALTAIGDTSADWVKIIPPESVDLWVYGDLVRDGRVNVSRLRVRSGPGISYREVGTLIRGVRVEVRGTVGDWLRITPPKGTYLWMSGKYLKVVQTPVQKPKPAVIKPVKKPGPSPVKPKQAIARKPPLPAPIVEPPPTPKEPQPVVYEGKRPSEETPAKVPAGLAGRKLLSSVKQGVSVDHVGVLRPAGFVWRRPSKYRLIKVDRKGRALTTCYLAGEASQLEALEGKTLSVFGREYWIQGVRYPVVVPEKILRKD